MTGLMSRIYDVLSQEDTISFSSKIVCVVGYEESLFKTLSTFMASSTSSNASMYTKEEFIS